MIRRYPLQVLRSSIVAMMVLFVVSGTASAHCDSMDGPVVQAARRALEARDVNLALIWVQKKDEPELLRAFHETLTVRNLNRKQGNSLIDTFSRRWCVSIVPVKEHPTLDSNRLDVISGRRFRLQIMRWRRVRPNNLSNC